MIVIAIVVLIDVCSYGSLFMWGSNIDGLLGVDTGEEKESKVPLLVEFNRHNPVKQVSQEIATRTAFNCSCSLNCDLRSIIAQFCCVGCIPLTWFFHSLLV